MSPRTAQVSPIEHAHARAAEEALSALDSGPTGLSAAEAARRLAEVGPNRLPAPPRDGLLKRFFKHFNDVLIYVLLGAAAITATLGHWIDTGVILGVVVINAIIGFIQEGKAEEALAGIRKMLSLRADARRDGQWIGVDADSLVPGDIVRLRSGDRVPADLRLIEATNLRIEESALTGESVPADKTTEAVAADAGVGDRFGMAYSGTLVATGRGSGVVVATGPDTELGRINRLIAEVQTRPRSPGRWRSSARSCRSSSSAWRRSCWASASRCTSSRWPRSSWPRSASRSPPSPRACPPSSPSRSRSACSAWRGATRSPAS
jgi:magnesium-transporting ATPase (P-type)